MRSSILIQMRPACALLLLIPMSAAAQSVVPSVALFVSVQNAASGADAGFGAGLAPGELFRVGSAEPITPFAAVQIQSIGGPAVRLPIIGKDSTHVLVRVPETFPLGQAKVLFTLGRNAGAPVSVAVVATASGYSGNGTCRPARVWRKTSAPAELQRRIP